jgi:hypothetical protein
VVGEPHVIIGPKHDLAFSIDVDNSISLALDRREIWVVAKLLGYLPILPLIAFLEDILFLAEESWLFDQNGSSPFCFILNGTA